MLATAIEINTKQVTFLEVYQYASLLMSALEHNYNHFIFRVMFV